MSDPDTESVSAAEGSLQNPSASSDSSDFSQHLLSETNQSFENWLGNLRNSPSELNVGSSPDISAVSFPYEPREISFDGTLNVNGYMAGVLRSEQGTLIVSPAGEIDGDIFVNVALINGSVRGDIRATMKVDLGGGARVIGDIETFELSIQPGAVFEGRCALHSDAEPAESGDPDESTPGELANGPADLSFAAAT